LTYQEQTNSPLNTLRLQHRLHREHFNINTHTAHWGEEKAGAFYTDHLKPQETTLHIDQGAEEEILFATHLKKAVKGFGTPENHVKIYQAFWPLRDDIEPYTHPILTYADLVATSDPRNIETSRLIYDEHIVQSCQQD